MEASCLEWSLLISVLLRDAMAVLRTVNAAKSYDQSIENVSRLRQGLLILNYWTNTEWYVYSYAFFVKHFSLCFAKNRNC